MTLGLDPLSLSGLAGGEASGAVVNARGRSRFGARVGIRDYGARLERHYKRRVEALGLAGSFKDFGVIVDFETPAEIELHDDERQLDEGVAALVARYGPVLFRNAFMSDQARAGCQRNVFKSLSFHLDRGATQSDHYSLFWRDPFDAETRQPRSSTTLVMSNPAAYLQALDEGAAPHQFRQRYELFQQRVPDGLIGELLFELPWSAPEGHGEIAVLDNRTVLHASYYVHEHNRGYPIAVRYLY